MNNASYLSHAEFARWELTAYNGLLNAMYEHNVHFYVASAAVRYRREIRPLWVRFQIDSHVCGIDERSLWILQKFRLPGDRVRAHVLIQGVAMQKGKLVEPPRLLKTMVGIDPALVDSLTRPNVADKATEELLEKYAAMEDALKDDASADDAIVMSKK